MNDLNTFKDLVLFCREQGVSRAKFGEFEFVLEPVEGDFEMEDEELSDEDVVGFPLIGAADAE